ncbi:L,D-transpeptidase [Synechococcus sp. 1G10]|uniref:L,D-transpeptidase n=1 Tax=Synechococcus sp. 1G10 TaxID=2025605 RepID=UPI001E58CF90|nr:L,D-transpeptidase [Synechococcus sp. 1G10]
MSPERFQDRFEAFIGEEQQVSGVWLLFGAITETEDAAVILDETAPWALRFSQKPPTPPPPVGGLDPRGSEEAGMVGPKLAAPVKPGDSYLLVNDRDEDLEAFDHTGTFLWKVPCLARGQGADNDWKHNSTDTPPVLYRLGQLYPDYEQNPNPPCSDTAMSYGWYSFDVVELENQEVKVGRAGIMLHGGGSGCGWPGAWAANQQLLPTLGCIRLHNVDLRDKVLPLYRKGTVYVGVFQET